MSLKAFDVFPKTIAEFRHKTASGGAVSLVCTALIVLLTLFELSDYLSNRTEEHLFVDTSRGQHIEISLDVTFPALPCSLVHLELQDISGNHQLDMSRNISKSRLDRDGSVLMADALPMGNAKLAELAKTASTDHGRKGGDLVLQGGQNRPLVIGAGENVLLSRLLAELMPGVFNNEEAIAEMRTHLGEGCHVQGTLRANKVAGNFHFAVDPNDQRTILTVYGDRESINMSHTVRHLALGPHYPGLVNPLDGMRKIITAGSGFFQYQMKVVPTIYEYSSGISVLSNQYSFTQIFRTTAETDKLPAVYFHYELSPIMAKFTVGARSFGSFLTGLCAIVGGVFTLSGVVDAIIFRLAAKVKPPATAHAAR